MHISKLTNPVTASPNEQVQNAINMLVAQDGLNDYNARLIEAIVHAITFSQGQYDRVVALGTELAQEQFDWTNQNSEWQQLENAPENPKNWKRP